MAEQPFVPSLRGDVQAAQGTYIRRPADDQLFAACLNNEFAYVLACRQIGKSSLKNAVAERLIGQGIRVARIDLNRIGQTVTGAEQWYFSLLDEIARNLELTTDTEEWWEQQSSLSTWAQRFVHFLDEVVLTEIKQPIVIFIDEIDMTLDLSFTNDLFAMIRSLYNDRAQNPAYRRLTFVLLGVASPDELIDDQKRTPFNVGKAISIRDFAQEECIPLRSYLEIHYPSKGSAYFDQIYQWTNGHPYLTQKLCHAVAQSAQSDEPQLVEALINEIFFKKGERTEDNLDFVQTRVLGDRYVVPMLQIYAKILRRRAVHDDKKSPAINRLQLYGLVVADQGRLHVRNKIYEKAFDQAWCKDNNPLNWTRITAYSLACVLVLVVGWFGFALWHDNNIIPNQAQKAQLDFYQAHQPEERVKLLATLFRLDSEYILQRSTIYGDQARALFFSMPNREDQLDLFRGNDSNILIVIKGLYMTLADVNQTDLSTPLLQAMVDDLLKLNHSKETSDLLAEVNHWVKGRNFSKQGQLQPALDAYNQAIAVKDENLSTRYERARTNIKLEQYKEALADLDQIIATVRQSGESMPSEQTISATFTMTPTSTFTSTPAQISTSTQTSIPKNFAIGTSTFIFTITITSPQSIATPTPTTMPVLDPVTSEFSTGAQMIAAVRNLINNNTKVISFAIQSNQQTYSNLVAFGLVPTLPAIALASTITPNPIVTVMPTSLLTATPLSFATSAPSETLILVATFHSSAPSNTEPHMKILRVIKDAVVNLGEQKLRIVVEPTKLTADERPQAEALGKRYNASIVIWGEETGVEIITNFLNLRHTNFDDASVTIMETEQTQLANPSAYARFITNDLPRQITFYVLFNVGQSYYLNTQYASAIKSIEAALAELPVGANPEGLAEAHFRLGWLYQQSPAKFDQAIIHYTQAIKLKPDDAKAYIGRGIALYAQGKLDEAITDYNQAIKLNSDNSDAYNNRGLAFTAQDKLDEAIADYDIAIKLKPDNPNVLYNRGSTFYQLGQLARALSDYDTALSLYRQGSDKIGEAKTLIQIGKTYSDQGNMQIALGSYDQALPLMQQVGNKTGEATALNNIGRVYDDLGQKQKALDFYSQALSIYRAVSDKASEAITLDNIGGIYDDLGEKQKALDFYNQALPLVRAVGDRAGEATTLNNIGRVYAALGEQQRALDFYTNALPLMQQVGNKAGEAITLYNIGFAHYILGDKQKALDYFNRTLQLVSQIGDRAGEATVLDSIGRIYADSGDKKAIDYFQQSLIIYQAVDDRVGEATALYHIAPMIEQEGKLDEAITYYTRIINIQADYANAYRNRGFLFKTQGNVQAAVADLRKYLELQPQATDRTKVETAIAELEAKLVKP